MKRVQLSKLAEIAEMLRDAELTRVSAAEQIRHAHATRREAILMQQRSLGGLSEDNPVGLGATVDRWCRWADRSVEALRRDEALAAAKVEECRLRARRAFGRAEVLRRLADRKTKS